MSSHLRYGVSAQKAADLEARMARLGIREADLEESFIRAQGPGGQHVNKTSTAVQLQHRPSGLEVKVQSSRSQSLNRFLARRLLVERLEAQVEGRRSAERQRIEKVRRQKRKRSKRARDKMLDNKRARGTTKALRASPRGHDD